VRAKLGSPVEAAGPMDGRETSRSIPSPNAAAHRTLEIPVGFPQLPQGQRLDSHPRCEKIWIGLGTPGSMIVRTQGSMTLKSHTPFLSPLVKYAGLSTMRWLHASFAAPAQSRLAR